MPLSDLAEAIQDSSGILQIERMRKKYFDKISKESVVAFSHYLLITWEGSVRLDELKIFDGIMSLKVRPYIVAVKQCYGCYRFGLL